MSDIVTSNSGKAADEAPIDAAAEKVNDPRRQTLPAEEKKLGIALVGLGTYSTAQLGPALTETEYCHLSGVVSGNAEKREQWRLKYKLKHTNLYSYEDFDSIAANREIDIVYITLPNALHAEYVIRAARVGKHVICEKPLATNVDDCHRMIEACREAGVRLSMGYRLHFDPYNQEMMRLGQQKVMGPINHVIARHCMDVGDQKQWRLNQALAGGGPLMDLGIYCVQGALYTVGELPIGVKAKFIPKTDPEKFPDVEEAIEWEMMFPEGASARCKCSYSENENCLRAETISGWFELKPAFLYNGLKGSTSEGPMMITSLNQQAAQMDDFALCIQNNAETRVPGEMGLRDVEILMAIYDSARSGKTVDLHLHGFQNLIEI